MCMKRRYVSIILLLITCVLSGKADNLGFAEEHPLVFGMDMDYAPMEYLDEQGIPCGHDVEFTQKLLDRLNIPFSYSPNTWKNIAEDILNGKVDLGMMVYSPYRKDLTNYSREVFKLYYQMVYRKDEKRSYGIRNVKGLSIAFMESRPIKDTLTKVGAEVHEITDLKQSLKDLSAGKYDGVICYSYQAGYLIDLLELDNLASEDLALMPREYCYVSNNKELIDAINAELDKMEAEGVIDDVYVDVKEQLGGLGIPVWVWYLVGSLIVISLLIFGLMQHRSNKLLQKEMKRVRESEERVRKSEELKTIFLNNMSHALRTPLNAIIGFSDLLMTSPKDGMAEEEQNKLLGLINDNGLQLLHLINELLSLSDIEKSSQLFAYQVTDIDREMSSCASEIRMELSDGVTLEVIEPVDGMRALVDPKLLRLVTMHLLENAQQHTEEGKITLSYYVKEGGLYVEVKDSGSGLPEDLKENIFSLLSDKNTYIQEETPGLGLSICKVIMRPTVTAPLYGSGFRLKYYKDWL